MQREEDAIVLEPADSVHDGPQRKQVVAARRGCANREFEPADLAGTDIVRCRRGEPVRREPVQRELRTLDVGGVARAQGGLLFGDASVPASGSGVAEGYDERRERSRVDDRIGALRAPGRVIA